MAARCGVLPQRADCAEGSGQGLDRLKFVVEFDGPSAFSHRGEEAVIDDASRVGPLRIERATGKSGFGRLFLIVRDLPRGDHSVHKSNDRSLPDIVKDSTKRR